MHLFKKARFCDRPRMSRTTGGGSRPRRAARCQRSCRVMPRLGPYLTLMSNRHSTSPTQFCRQDTANAGEIRKPSERESEAIRQSGTPRVSKDTGEREEKRERERE